jgi:hypothetical protein
MRFVSTKIHGLLDYMMSIVLMGSPWLLGFARAEGETWIPVILGTTMLIYSLFTDYEYGALKILPVRAHLLFDLVSGVFLAASPWILGFADYVFLPHLVLGIAEVGAALVTKTVPAYASGSGRQSGPARTGAIIDSRT